MPSRHVTTLFILVLYPLLSIDALSADKRALEDTSLVEPRYLFARSLGTMPLDSRVVDVRERSSSALDTSSQLGKSEDLEYLRDLIISDLLDVTINDDRIQSLISSIQLEGFWKDINYEDVSITGFEHTRHLNNTLLLSRAWRSSQSVYHQSPEVKDAIHKALEFWIRNDFISDNWYHNEISGPATLVRIALLIDEDLTESQTDEIMRMAHRASLLAWGARPGGDLIRILGIMAERAIFERDAEALEEAVDSMVEQITFTSGRGLKPDYSFHHRTDRVTSVLSYGRGYANAFADWAYRLAGTRFSFEEEALRLLIDYFLDGIARTMVHGWYNDPGAMNRGMSRPGALNARGSALPKKLLHATDYRADELQNIANIRDGLQTPNITANRFFWHSEYLSHQRPHYFTSVRMHSARTLNMEAPHGNQGLKQHFFADGANFISRTGREYHDIFVAWDWRKIPGTTVLQRPEHPGHREIVKAGRTDFVGAVSDSIFGAAAFDFESAHEPLKARKSWFFFDDEFVALGAGIQSDSDDPIATTVNQSLLNGDVYVKRSEDREILNQGEYSFSHVDWVHHDHIAYLFPVPVPISLKNKTSSGAWRSINHQPWATDDLVEKELFTLWFDHRLPENESTYQYIVVPDIEVSEVDDYRESSQIEILTNTPEIQAVRHHELNQIQIVFYEPGQIDLGDGVTLRSEHRGLLIVEKSGSTIDKIIVADPTRLQQEFKFELTGRFEGAADHWMSEWDEERALSLVRVALPDGDDAGKSVSLKSFESRNAETLASFTAQSDHEPVSNSHHNIGDHYGGGVIYWIDEAGESMLIAAEEDHSSRTRWNYGDLKVTHADGDGIGEGIMNTQRIIEHHRDEDPESVYAAKVCDDYLGGGYDDWYLPSKTELDLMYSQKEKIGGFDNALYWSSTEYGIGFAWEQYFYGYGGQYTSPKGSSRVRCVRYVVNN